MIPPQLDLHTIDIITVDLIKWIKKARPAYQFGTDKEWDSLIERVTGYRTEEGMNDMLLSIEKRLGFHPSAAIERDKMLKALKKDLQTRFISSGNPWSRGRNSGLLECCNIIDELRQAGEE